MKTEPSSYKQIAKQLGIPTSSILFLTDSPKGKAAYFATRGFIKHWSFCVKQRPPHQFAPAATRSSSSVLEAPEVDPVIWNHLLSSDHSMRSSLQLISEAVKQSTRVSFFTIYFLMSFMIPIIQKSSSCSKFAIHLHESSL